MLLNKYQTKAVHYVFGPCLILAGAGSGKTRVIINKIIHLISNHGYHPNQITAITFTNKAVNEMKNRIINELSCKIVNTMRISTFHALGLEIIKSGLKLLNMKSNFSIFDDQDQISILKDILLQKDKVLLNQIRQKISNWKNMLVCPEQAKLLSTSIKDLKYVNYYKLYNSYLKSSNTIDFDDLIFLPTTLFKSHEMLRKHWNDKIGYLLVDEYQDTNLIQYELIKLLSKNKSNFTLVGDNDQSIYSWRGASIHNFFSLKKDYPNLCTITMQRNYRSTGRILTVANSLISNNIPFFKKELFSDFNYGPTIKIISAYNELNEAKIVLERIISHKAMYNSQYKDYAILYRNNYQVKIFEKILVQLNIPYKILAHSSFFSRTEIKDLLAYLRLIINPDDDLAFLRIVNKPSRRIGITTLQKLKSWSQKRKKSLFYSSLDVRLKFILPVFSYNQLQEFVYLIQKIICQIRLKSVETLEKLVQMIKYEQWLISTLKDFKLYDSSINNINILLNWIINELKNKNQNNPNICQLNNLSEIISQFVLRCSSFDNDDKENSVQLMTLHASKGLEFLYVFIIGIEEGILPNYRSIEQNNIDEERRLMYVGITRARKELFLSYSTQRCQYGTMLFTEPSRFLLELPQSDVLWEKNKFQDMNQNVNIQNKYFIKKIQNALKKNFS